MFYGLVFSNEENIKAENSWAKILSTKLAALRCQLGKTVAA
jgi:hypothetical protein